jgi:hypothetical protein
LLPTPGTVFVGLDFGLTPAAAFVQRQADGQWWGVGELVATSMNNTEFAIELKAMCARLRDKVPGLTFIFRGDPSGDKRAETDGRTTFAVYRAAGIAALPASSNDPQLRRAALERVLTRSIKGRPAFLLSPSMSWTRKALTGAWCYRRKRIAGKDQFTDVADKNEYSHIGEALEYALMDAGEHALINAASMAAPVPTARPVQVRNKWDPFAV